jgi:TRAP-type C4-dicarboxylate transport system substrate-binding protein
MDPRRSNLVKLSLGIIAIVLLVSLLASSIACSSPAPATSAPAISAAPTQSVAQPVKLVFSTHEPGQGLYFEGFWKPWIAEVEKRTGGKVKIEAHFNGELAGPPDAWDVLVNKTVDISNVHLNNYPDKFPMTDMAGFTTYSLVNYRPSRVMWELYNKYPQMQKELEDVHVMYFGSTYWTSLATTKKPVRTLEDGKGMKSVGTGKWQNIRQEKLGWVPVSMGPMDILPSLQTGVVDGGPLGTLVILKDFGWGEFLPYVTHVRLQNIPILIGMNKDVWNKLPADVQQAIDGMREWTIDLHDSFFVKAENQLIPELQNQYKTEFITPSQEELAKWDALDKPVWDQFADSLEAKGLPGKALMADYIALEKKYSSSEYAPK